MVAPPAQNASDTGKSPARPPGPGVAMPRTFTFAASFVSECDGNSYAEILHLSLSDRFRMTSFNFISDEAR